MIDLKPIYEYLADAEGREWTAEDSAYVRDKFQQVEAVASKVIEKRCEEMERQFRRYALQAQSGKVSAR
jgi:hypothetical protein